MLQENFKLYKKLPECIHDDKEVSKIYNENVCKYTESLSSGLYYALESAKEPKGLDALPLDMLGEVTKFLDLRDYLKVRLVNKQIHTESNKSFAEREESRNNAEQNRSK